MLFGKGLTAPISTYGIVFRDEEQLLAKAADFKEEMQAKGFCYSDDEAIMGVMLNDTAAMRLELAETDKPFDDRTLNELIKASHIFHHGEMENNPYFKNIKFNDSNAGRFALTHGAYAKYELMMYNSPVTKANGMTVPCIGCFDYEFTYPAVSENNKIWMSLTPNEVYSFAAPIEEARGNVLTLGCGMGYYAYMVSAKENVSHVTIIEKETEVIELFKKYILPQFPHPEKVSVLQADAFDYMEELPDGKFDCCLADLWIGCNDTIPYLALKHICTKFEKMKMTYWLEDSLAGMMMDYVKFIISEEYHKNNHMRFPVIKDMTEDEKFKLNYIRNLFKDVKITNTEQLDYYLDYRNIAKLIK